MINIFLVFLAIFKDKFMDDKCTIREMGFREIRTQYTEHAAK